MLTVLLTVVVDEGKNTKYTCNGNRFEVFEGIVRTHSCINVWKKV